MMLSWRLGTTPEKRIHRVIPAEKAAEHLVGLFHVELGAALLEWVRSPAPAATAAVFAEGVVVTPFGLVRED
jgi:hypothetical protein